RFLRQVIRSLKQPRIWKSLRAGELINSEIQRRLRYEYDAYAFRLRAQVHLYVLKLSRALERENALFDFRRRKGFACMLREGFRELLNTDIGTARHFHGRDSLTFVREKFGSIDSR